MSVKRHTGYNMLGAALPTLVSLVTVPAYLHAIGEARFGILAVAWLLLGYFGQFDLGLGMATSHHIAAAGDDRGEERAQLFWSALATNLSLGIIGGLIILPVAYFYFGRVMIIDPAMRSEAVDAVPWLVLAVPLATTTGVLSGTLQGMSRFGRLNLISGAGTVLFQLLPLAAALFWSSSLTVVLPIALLARLFTMLVLWLEVRRLVLRTYRFVYSQARTIMMLKYGGWVTVSALFSPFLVILDRFAIGGLVGAAAVSHFTVPFNLGERLMILGNSLGSALFPKLSALKGKEAQDLCIRSEQVLMAGMLAIMVLAIFAIEPFLHLWIGKDFAARSAPAGQILMIGIWFEAISRVPLYALRGQTRPRAVAKVDLIQILPYLVILYFALTEAGLVGAAWAYVFRSTFNYALLGYEMGTLKSTRWMAMACAVILGMSLALAQRSAAWSPVWLLGLAGCMALAGVFAARHLPPDLTQAVLARLKRRPSA